MESWLYLGSFKHPHGYLLSLSANSIICGIPSVYVGHDMRPNGVVIAALVIFSVFGVPLAITYRVPYALISTSIEPLGLGQGGHQFSGLCAFVQFYLMEMWRGIGIASLNCSFTRLSMDVLNLAIVIPQVVVSLGSGLWDQLGGENSPAFAVAAIAAFTSGLISILAIPQSSASAQTQKTRPLMRYSVVLVPNILDACIMIIKVFFRQPKYVHS